MENEDYHFEFSDSQGLIAYLNYLYEDVNGEPVPPLKELLWSFEIAQHILKKLNN